MDRGSESSRIFDYTMLFDDTVGEILMKLDGAKKCDVVDEMVEVLDMAMLMDVRLKVFRYAKSKLLKTVTQPGEMDIDPKHRNALNINTPRDAERMIEEWDLIARKGQQKVAVDAIDLLAYLSGDDPFFPYKLMKKRAKKGKKKTMHNRKKSTKQSTIPFKPTPSETTVNEGDLEANDTSEDSDDGSSVCADKTVVSEDGEIEEESMDDSCEDMSGDESDHSANVEGAEHTKK